MKSINLFLIKVRNKINRMEWKIKLLINEQNRYKTLIKNVILFYFKIKNKKMKW